MKKQEPKSLADVLSADRSALSQLEKQARSQLALADRIRAGLPADLAQALVGCHVDETGALVIRATSPEWAARFRFEESRLLELCRSDGSSAERVHVKVSPAGRY